MERKIKVDDDFELYDKHTFCFNPGVNVLVGPNGSGKSTLINNIKDWCKKQDIECIYYDNLLDGGSNSLSNALFNGSMEQLAVLSNSSEGQRIMVNLGNVVSKIGQSMRDNPDKELWILLDAIDSGLSVDNIIQVKKYLLDYISNVVSEKFDGKSMFIVVSANSYELVKGYDCINVKNASHRQFKTYDSYKKYILNMVEEYSEEEDK